MGRSLLRLTAVLAVLALVIVACSNDALPIPEAVAVEGDFDVRTVADGFSGPTQMVFGPNGDLFIAELNGAEDDATGRVLRLSLSDPSNRTVLQDNLDKPTGIAVVGDRLWIMERQRLSVMALAPGAERTIVADDLPFNGRSQGTLTITPDGALLYNTSGSKRGPNRIDGSGTLFSIAAVADGPSEPVVIATGFKHAYAHLVDPDGQLWSVEMTDGTFDGARGEDELLGVAIGDDAGWPQCVDDNRPVIEFGGTAETCADAPRSHALFGAGATPTSFIIAPWDPDLFVVSLWIRSQVVTVPRTQANGSPHVPTSFINGIESPQHLLVDGARLLISDHETGRIFSISPN